MIIVNGILLHSITTVLTFGSNSNSLTPKTLQRFVNGYSIMEKTQMVGFFLQELILSVIYIREAVRLLKLSETVHDDAQSVQDGTSHGHLRNSRVRKTIYQLLAINIIIIIMDLALLGVEFANLYLIETTLKGVVYSVKLKLEFAVLGKLVQFVRNRATSSDSSAPRLPGHTVERRGTYSGATIEKTETNRSNTSVTRTNASLFGNAVQNGTNVHHFPEFVDPDRVNIDVTHAQPAGNKGEAGHGWETRVQDDGENWRRRAKVNRGSWIDEEMDKNNIG
jgi:hypothetical protein